MMRGAGLHGLWYLCVQEETMRSFATRRYVPEERGKVSEGSSWGSGMVGRARIGDCVILSFSGIQGDTKGQGREYRKLSIGVCKVISSFGEGWTCQRPWILRLDFIP